MKKKTNTIKNVVFNHKELDTPEAKTLVIYLWNRLKSLEDKKADLFLDMQVVEKEIIQAQEDFSRITKVCKVEFEEIEVEDKEVEQCNLVINNPSDARNLSYGRE